MNSTPDYALFAERSRCYPNFVAKLGNGKILVVEYKERGFVNKDLEENERLGELWADRSGGQGSFLM